jgi:subtilase family serine protease
MKILVGGTSMASPLVAGIIADAQQGQHTVFGFTDPVLYRLNGTSALHDMLPSTSATPALFRGVACNLQLCRAPAHAPALITFDDQSRRMPGYTGQVTLKGYDNMTGIGTPNGQQFVMALRGIES